MSLKKAFLVRDLDLLCCCVLLLPVNGERRRSAVGLLELHFFPPLSREDLCGREVSGGIIPLAGN